MACYKPIQAYKSLYYKTDKGKSLIVFKVDTISNKPYEKLTLPCGRCIGCRIDKSREWAIRCVHEASLHEENCFITLTFNDENLFIDDGNGNIEVQQSLVKSDFQKFIKRLRKKIHPQKIRYFHCGEYGELEERPHHHACIFGYDFPDKVLWTIRKGIRLYRSESLEKLWPYGFCTIGEVTWESAAYVARYVTKKLNGDRAFDKYVKDVDIENGTCTYLEPEYITMSRRPGIGKNWYEKYKQDLDKDFLTINGDKYKIPRYYDGLYEIENLKGYEQKKYLRKLKALENPEENHLIRLKVKEKCKEKSIKNLKRSYENGSENL